MNDRYVVQDDGSIMWSANHDVRLPHMDRIEISGLRVSVIVSYGADAAGILARSCHVVWPLLRTVPNDTHASLQTTFPPVALSVNGTPVNERLLTVRHRGILEMASETECGLQVTRQIFASRQHPAAVERIVVTHAGTVAVTLGLSGAAKIITDPAKGVTGAYIQEALVSHADGVTLAPGESVTMGIAYTGRRDGDPALSVDVEAELRERETYVEGLFGTLVLQTPDPVLNRMFAFAKIRAAESIFATRGGLMHGPGGGAYYAAIWANDQAEYANPFFAYMGDPNGDESSLNAYRHFARFMNPEFVRIPSSIIAEGLDVWQGAGDRGDQAMIAYGAARYALTRGDSAVARELWPLIVWCLEYLERKTNAEGVIFSDCDELEGRFRAGHYNLNTSSLTYDALLSASYLARDLGKPDESSVFARRAERLKSDIERFFGADFYGNKTYRYHEDNTTLRAWICTPLCMGLFDRVDGTLAALFSDRLWTDDGIRSDEGSETFWDRATLYAMRGALAAGAADRVLPYLAAYSRRRLLGDHVPYAIEAWPEGNQRHLSAESALYGRIFTEGLLGFRPTGLRSFTLTPQWPADWEDVLLRRFHVAGGVCDIAATRAGLRVEGEGFTVTPQPNGVYQINRAGPV